MTADPDEIERIVQAVLRKLPRGAGPSSGPRAEASGSRDTVGTGTPASLVVADRVVTLGTLAGRLAGVKRVVHAPGVVITPAVRDELRRRRIDLACDGSAASQTEDDPLVVGVCQADYEPSALWTALANSGNCVHELAAGTLEQLVQEMTREVTHFDRLGMLLTGQPYAALCLANRCGEVRAAWGIDVQTVNEAVQAIAANVLIIDPRRHGPFELLNMARAYLRSGPRRCPEILRGRAGGATGEPLR